MAGRLDAVDLPSDVLLIAVYDQGPWDIVDLLSALQDVDTDAFPAFDGLYVSDDAASMVDDLLMFGRLGFTSKPDGDGQHVAITERGSVMASILLDELSEDQWRALQHAGVCR